MFVRSNLFILYSYQPSHEDELELTLDQIIDYLGEVEDGWWKGRSQQTGQVLFLFAYASVCKLHCSRFAGTCDKNPT